MIEEIELLISYLGPDYPIGMSKDVLSPISLSSPKIFFVSGKEEILINAIDVNDNKSIYNKETYDLLTKMLGAMKLSLDEVEFISYFDDENLKEVVTHLKEKVTKYGSSIVVVFWGSKLLSLLKKQYGEKCNNGLFHILDHDGLSITIMPTYHPSQIINNQSLKKEVWMHLQEVMKQIKY